jgi:hypothetical protein
MAGPNFSSSDAFSAIFLNPQDPPLIDVLRKRAKKTDATRE